MKRTLILSLCLLCMISAFGQKAKVKNHKVKANQYLLPKTGFDQSTTAYYVEIAGRLSSMQSLGYSETKLKKSININGYTQVQEPVGAKVYLQIEGPTGSPLKLITNNKKDKNGKTWKEYQYEVTFSTSINTKVIDATTKTLFDKSIPLTQAKRTSAYTSTAKLKKAFNSTEFYLGHRKAILAAALKSTNEQLNMQFGYRKYTNRVHYRKLTNKKHPDYASWKKYEEQIKLASESLTAEDNSSFIEKSAEAIAFWKEKEPTYSADDKEQKKLKFVCLLNLTQAHFYADQFDIAKNYAQQIIDTKVDEKEGQKLIKEIDDVVKKLDKLGRDTRFFNIEVSEEMVQAQEEHIAATQAAIASGDIRSYPDFNSKLRVSANSIIAPTYSYSSNGTETAGYFVYEEEIRKGTPDFRQPKKIRFGYEKNGVVGVGTPNYARLDSFLVDSIMYRIQDMSIGSGLTKVKLKNAVVETVAEFDKTTVYYVIPPMMTISKMGQKSEASAELIIYDKSKDKHFTTKLLLGGIDKAMKKIIAECPEAMDYIENVQKEHKKVSILNRLAGFESGDVVLRTLELYDSCE